MGICYSDLFFGLRKGEALALTKADIDFKTKLPKISENTAKPVESTEMQEFELNFNPFKTLEDFNLRTDIFADLNIKNIEDLGKQGILIFKNSA